MAERNCGACHELSRVTRAGYDKPAWLNTTHMMFNLGAQLNPAEIDTAAASPWPAAG